MNALIVYTHMEPEKIMRSSLNDGLLRILGAASDFQALELDGIVASVDCCHQKPPRLNWTGDVTMSSSAPTRVATGGTG